jgi:hypothetical protein
MLWVRLCIYVPKRITDICTVESTKDDKWLDKLEPQGLVRCPTAECMDGTREDIMAKIDEWCDDLDASSNILWISGFLGVGKSAIARKLATRLKSSHSGGHSSSNMNWRQFRHLLTSGAHSHSTSPASTPLRGVPSSLN